MKANILTGTNEYTPGRLEYSKTGFIQEITVALLKNTKSWLKSPNSQDLLDISEKTPSNRSQEEHRNAHREYRKIMLEKEIESIMEIFTN